MNRRQLAEEVADFIRTSVGNNDTEDVDLDDAGTDVENFISNLDDTSDVEEG
jgi:hypothetical protein